MLVSNNAGLIDQYEKEYELWRCAFTHMQRYGKQAVIVEDKRGVHKVSLPDVLYNLYSARAKELDTSKRNSFAVSKLYQMYFTECKSYHIPVKATMAEFVRLHV